MSHYKIEDTYQPGEYRRFGDDMAYVVGRCGADVVLGVTEGRELLLDLSAGIIRLGMVSDDAPMPPDDNSEHDDFDWGEWSQEIRQSITDSGWQI